MMPHKCIIFSFIIVFMGCISQDTIPQNYLDKGHYFFDKAEKEKDSKQKKEYYLKAMHYFWVSYCNHQKIAKEADNKFNNTKRILEENYNMKFNFSENKTYLMSKEETPR